MNKRPPPTSTLFPYTTLFRSRSASWSTLSRCRKSESRSVARRSPSMPSYHHRCVKATTPRSEEHTSELQSRPHLVCRLLLEKKKGTNGLPCPPPHWHDRWGYD